MTALEAGKLSGAGKSWLMVGLGGGFLLSISLFFFPEMEGLLLGPLT